MNIITIYSKNIYRRSVAGINIYKLLYVIGTKQQPRITYHLPSPIRIAILYQYRTVLSSMMYTAVFHDVAVRKVVKLFSISAFNLHNAPQHHKRDKG